MNKRIVTACAVAGGAILASSSAAAQPTQARHATVELVADIASIQPGRPFTVGLHLVMEESWHTYWKNPGDAGMATSIRWELPEGFSAGDIQWPAPYPFGEPPEVSYGFEGELLLPVTITPPSTLRPGQSMTLRAHAGWLICQDVCISDKVELDLKLPVLKDAPKPSQRSGLFENTEDRMPKPLSGMKLSASRHEDGYLLRIIADAPVSDRTAFTFFVGEEEVLNHSAPQEASIDGTTVTLMLHDSDYATAPASRLHGVLVVTENGLNTGEEHRPTKRQTYTIDVPVENSIDTASDRTK